jgi:hypothetical protein
MPKVLLPKNEEIKSFQPHQADLTTDIENGAERVCLTLGTTVG